MLIFEKVYEDERGGIYVISLPDGKDVVINTTKAGFARGGCYHELNDEHFVVIEGSAMFRIGNETRFYSTGMSAFIPKGTPHMMVADTDCVTMEWGATRSEKNSYDPGMRQRVDEINKERKHELQNKTG